MGRTVRLGDGPRSLDGLVPGRAVPPHSSRGANPFVRRARPRTHGCRGWRSLRRRSGEWDGAAHEPRERSQCLRNGVVVPWGAVVEVLKTLAVEQGA